MAVPVSIPDSNGTLFLQALNTAFDETIQHIGTIAALRATTPTSTNLIIAVTGYYTSADNIGVREYYWDAASTEADNGGTIIQVTGVTTGRWKIKYSGAVNVKWFGAISDYTGTPYALGTGTNNAPFFISALSVSNNIFVPNGKYLISGTIGVFDHVIIEGESQNDTFIYTSGTTTLFTINSAGNTSEFKNITFYGNILNSITDLTRCIDGDTIRIKTYNARFMYFGNDAIYLTNAIDCSFENSYFSGGYSAQAAGLTTTRTSSGVVIDNGTWGTNNSILFKKCYFQSWLYGIKIISPSLVSVEDCVTEFNFIGTYMYRLSGGIGGLVNFNMNWLEQNYYSLSGGALFNDFNDQTNALKAIQQVQIGSRQYQWDINGRDKITGLYANKQLNMPYSATYMDSLQVNSGLSVVNSTSGVSANILSSGNCDSYSFVPQINVTTLTRPSGLASLARININTLGTTGLPWTFRIESAGNTTTIKQRLSDVDATTGSIKILRHEVDSGATASRPASPTTGMMFYDTTLSKPIWYSGTAWKDAAGTTV